MLSACLVSLGASALGLFVLVPASKSVGLLDYPDNRKQHEFATPLVGGLSIFLGLLAGWYWLGLSGRFGDVVLGTGCALIALGAIDDRFGLRVSIRVAVQIVAILTVILTTGVHVHSLGMLSGHELTLGWLGIPFTIFAVIGLINAFNLMDGIDGLAGCLALVSTTAIALLASHVPAYMTALVLLLAVAMYPYLFSNLGLLGRKGKVFLGDAGSVVLGYIIAWALIYVSQATPPQISPGLVLWCVALPVFDTLAVMYRRLARGVSPFTPDRTHVHHLLMNAGMSSRATLVCLVAFAAAMPFLGFAIHKFLGPIANLTTFIVVLVLYIAATTRLWKAQNAQQYPATLQARRIPAERERVTRS